MNRYIARFAEALANDEKLAQEFLALGRNPDMNRVIDFARSHGYNFTEKDVIEFRRTAAEIDEDELTGAIDGGIPFVLRRFRDKTSTLVGKCVQKYKEKKGQK